MLLELKGFKTIALKYYCKGTIKPERNYFKRQIKQMIDYIDDPSS